MNYLKYKYIAHRGLHDGDIPENSTLAFKRALEYGYAIELDVNITKDNKVIDAANQLKDGEIGRAHV